MIHPMTQQMMVISISHVLPFTQLYEWLLFKFMENFTLCSSIIYFLGDVIVNKYDDIVKVLGYLYVLHPF